MARDRQRDLASASFALWVLAVIATLFFLRAARELFIPIVLAALISYALDPVVRWLKHRRVPRWIGAGVLLASLAGAAIWGSVALRDDAERTVRELPQTVRLIRQRMEASGAAGFFARLQEALAEARAASAGAGRPSDPGGTAAPGAGAVQKLSASLVSLAGNLIVIFFLVYFLLIFAGRYKRRIVELADNRLSARRTAEEVIDEINWQIARFLLVRLVTAAFVGVATWLALRAMGAPQPGLWGALAGVFNSIPYFGPMIVSGGLLIVGAVSGGLTEALEYSGAALLITSLEGWLITPPLMGRAARMNTLAVFIGLLVWTWVWGIWGTLLAVPMLAVMKAIADHVDRLQPLARLLAED